MSKSALIGHTGFVGSTLMRHGDYTCMFNSRNISAICGGQFDQIVCAGVSAAKWLANKEPESDWRGIKHLMDCLEHVSTEHFVLISTIDVYRDPIGLSELDLPPTDGLHPYGLHRLALEAFIAERYPSHSIIRLPALFGEGLKKNALFDLITGNMTHRIFPNASFQWYPLQRLCADLKTIVDARLRLVNITSEPITMEAVRARFFPQAVIAEPTPSPPRYDLRSINDALLGGHGGYHLDADAVFHELSVFLSGSVV